MVQVSCQERVLEENRCAILWIKKIIENLKILKYFIWFCSVCKFCIQQFQKSYRSIVPIIQTLLGTIPYIGQNEFFWMGKPGKN